MPNVANVANRPRTLDAVGIVYTLRQMYRKLFAPNGHFRMKTRLPIHLKPSQPKDAEENVNAQFTIIMWV